jgi:hypothetical protein
MGLVRKPIAITGTHRCWTGAMRTPRTPYIRGSRGVPARRKGWQGAVGDRDPDPESPITGV